MAADDLQQRFPEMRPVKSPPHMFRLNGCGVALYGARDNDPETGTYIKTWCICLVFIPVLALRAYRVVKAEGGWYFIGREPLSLFAKAWNATLVIGLAAWLSLVAWNDHTQSPSYRAGQRLAQADAHAAAGRLLEAANDYRAVANTGTSHAADARAGLQSLLTGPVKQAPPDVAAGVYALALEPASGSALGGLVQPVVDQAIDHADRAAPADPRGAVAILDAVATAQPGSADVASRLEPLLGAILKDNPSDVDAASRLALIHETRGELDACDRLLTPVADRLGDTEAARLLGQLRAQQGRHDESFRLLGPYAQSRLKRMHEADDAVNAAVKQAWDRELNELREGRGPTSLFEQYELAATEEEKELLVANYVSPRVRDDPAVKAAGDALARESAIVPVALDLAIVRLMRAQGMSDPEARRVELEAAEQTFVAIQGAASESDVFRLYLGEVKYWLGKHDEGRRLFDELLDSTQRDPATVLAVAARLRSVGAHSEARTLAEEAYGKATDPDIRHQAASIRAVLFVDTDDRITWLENCSQGAVDIQADLATAKGHRAAAQGRRDEAADLYRRSLAIYEQMPQDSASCNNAALVHFALASLTGDRAQFDIGLAKMDQAVSMLPGNSTLLANVSGVVLQGALREVIGDRINLEAIHADAAFDVLPYLYDTAAQEQELVARLRSHPGVLKALAYMDKLVVLAPKSINSYALPLAVQANLEDAAGLRRLAERLGQTSLDFELVRKESLAFYRGERDSKLIEELGPQMELMRHDVAAVDGTDPALATTFAVAVGNLVAATVHQSVVTGPLGEEESRTLVELARRAYARAPSQGSRNSLIVALLAQADGRIAATMPEYADWCRRNQRNTFASMRLALAVDRPGPVKEAVLRDPAVVEAVALLVTGSLLVNKGVNGWAWALMSAVDRPAADKTAAVFARLEWRLLSEQLKQRLAPLSVANAVHHHWTLRALGDDAGARRVLKEVADAGMPLPEGLP